MAERSLVINRLKYSYEGLFDASEFYNLISSYFYERGWEWYEKMNEEQVTPSGKQIRLVLRPWKDVSDYHKAEIKMKINLINIKEVEVEQSGQQLQLNQGIIKITTDAYILSDRKDKWTITEKPFYWFLALVMERYFYRNYLTKFNNWLKSDVDDLFIRIKMYLNNYKYTKT